MQACGMAGVTYQATRPTLPRVVVTYPCSAVIATWSREEQAWFRDFMEHDLSRRILGPHTLVHTVQASRLARAADIEGDLALLGVEGNHIAVFAPRWLPHAEDIFEIYTEKMRVVWAKQPPGPLLYLMNDKREKVLRCRGDHRPLYHFKLYTIERGMRYRDPTPSLVLILI